MSKKFKKRGDNQNIVKANEQLSTVEKKIGHRKLKIRAMCTHTKSPMEPALTYREEGGKIVWICKLCGDKVDLNRIPEDKLKEAINTVNQACNLVKLMSNDGERDRRLVEEIISDIQLKLNAYLVPAYNGALNSSAKQNNRRNRRNRNGGVTWGND